MISQRSHSPLRYPGGKSSLYPQVSEILRLNSLERSHYVEPYAGGCGLALTLLYEGHVCDVHLNDLDPAIWSFWKCVLDHTEALVSRIESTDITLEEWRKQKAIFTECNAKQVLLLGFATLFLNRTNRSGIIKGAGVIGGLNQNGVYKIDCRFNKPELIRRIRRVAKYKSRIHLYNLDALDFMQQISQVLPRNSFFCIDPPYFNKGSSLYTNFYGRDEHLAVSKAVLRLKFPFIVTYDLTPEIVDLYRKRSQFAFGINYSVQTKRVGSEVLIASSRLKIPENLAVGRIEPETVGVEAQASDRQL